LKKVIAYGKKIFGRVGGKNNLIKTQKGSGAGSAYGGRSVTFGGKEK